MYRDGARLFLDIQSVDDDVEQQKLLTGLKLIWDYCFPRLLAMADKCDPEIWYALGDSYSHGRGTPRDRDEEIKWFERAAEAGHTRAMVRLGSRLRYPECERSSEAIAWYRKAAEKGDTGGMIKLGFAYRDGDGVPVDDQEAARWFEMAANGGDHCAALYAGKIYFHQLNDPKRALHWLLRAADVGCTEGYFEIALLYDDRKAPTYNPAAAARWYHVVAERQEWGASHSMLALSRLYRDGVGVRRSPTIARMWLLRLVATTKEARPREKAAKLLKEMDGDLL